MHRRRQRAPDTQEIEVQPLADDGPPAPAEPSDEDVARRLDGRPWLRRLVLAGVVVLVAVPAGLRVQLARVRAEARQAEAVQYHDEVVELVARDRLAGIDQLVIDARASNDAALDELEQARTVMATLGLQEPKLAQVQEQTQLLLEAYEVQDALEEAAIEEQKRLQPQAASCVLDRVRALGRVAIGHEPGAPSEACAAVAGRSAGGG